MVSSNMIRLLRYLKPYKSKIILVLALMFISSLLNLIPPFLMQISIDNYILQGNLVGILLVCFGFLLFGLTLGITSYFQRYFSQYIGQRVINDLRIEIFEHLNQLSFEYFDKTRTGDVISRVISDTNRLTRFLSVGLINLVSNVTLLIAVTFLMFSWDVSFGFIFLGIMPFLAMGMISFSKKVTPANRRARKANGILASEIQECFDGIKEVKLYGREDYMTDIFQKWNQEYYAAVMESNKYSSFWMPYVPFVLSISSAIMLMSGGIIVANEQLTIGFLVAATSYFGTMMRPIRMITRFLGMYNNAIAASDRIFEILDRESSIKDAPDSTELEDVKGNVEFSDVSFYYYLGHDILSNINLNIEPGSVIAFVGPSGVGKTTLLHLVPRFYEVKSGAVKIDGHDVRGIKLRSLRKNVGIVMQNTFLFDGTLGENISYGKSDAIPEEIQNAAKVAQLDTFIESLPRGYETLIGERGVRLSGGQAQRLSLARVIITDPKVLILDEPTANVDAVTDHKVMQAVRNAMSGRTTLVIAHRLWTIKNADKIVLMKDGKIEAVGSHEELLVSSKFYMEFFASQFLNSSNRTDDKKNDNHQMKKSNADELLHRQKSTKRKKSKKSQSKMKYYKEDNL